MSRSPCPSPSPPPSLYWKLLLLCPHLSDLSSNMQQKLSWICWKLRSSHAATHEPSRSASTLPLRDLNVPVFTLSVTSSHIPSLSAPGTAEFVDLSACGRERERQLHVVVQGISSLARSLDLECLKRTVLGTCSLATFVPAPLCDDRLPEASGGNTTLLLSTSSSYSFLHFFSLSSSPPPPSSLLNLYLFRPSLLIS